MPNVPSKQPNGHIKAEEGQQQITPVIPHITDRYIPISHITRALSRAAYAELLNLQNTLTDLSDQKRKRKIIEYASQFRQEFAKALVLQTWAENAQSISRAIDARAWLQGQKNCFDNLNRIFRDQLINGLQKAQTPAPAFDTAIQILSGDYLKTERYSWKDQHSGREPLNAIEVAETLNRLNVLINLRLSSHEIIPSTFHKYSVATGRVTFHVEREFNASFFFATDDIRAADLQWFMVDFNFDFNSDGTPLPIKLEVEAISNNVLLKANQDNKDQLVEIYSFLHRFTNQYKLERLFDDFARLGVLQPGSLNIKYASAQRLLAIGFWQQRTKTTRALLHTLTISIAAAPLVNTDRLLTGTSRSVDFDCGHLSATVRLADEEVATFKVHQDARALLSEAQTVLGRHRLRELHETLQLGSISDGCLSIPITRESDLIVTIDSQSGHYIAVAEDNSVVSLAKRLREATDTAECAIRVHTWLKSNQRQSSMEIARKNGWQNLTISKDALNSKVWEQLTSVPTEDCLFLTRHQESWWNTSGTSWAVVVVLHQNPCLLLVELVANMTNSTYDIPWSTTIDPIMSSMQVLDLACLDRAWRSATVHIILTKLTRSLDKHTITWRSAEPRGSEWDGLMLPTIEIRAADISSRVWTKAVVSLSFQDVCKSTDGGLIASFEAEKTISDAFDLRTVNDAMIVLIPNSSKFKLNFVGLIAQQPDFLLEQFLAKWSLIEVTAHTINEATSTSNPLILENYGLDYARFSYADRKCIIQINQEFLPTFSLTITLGTTNRRLNPHHRVIQHLNDLAARYTKNMRVVFESLLFTYNVLDMLAILEQENYDNPEFYIIIRSLVEYRIYYPAKQVALLIRATLAPSKEKLPEAYRELGLEKNVIWHFTDASQSLKSAIPGQRKIEACTTLFQEGLNDKLNTQRTFPEGSGIGCTPELTGLVLREIHTLIMTT